jgi:hypothetical protein
MYQADMMLKVPSFNDYTFDIANGIQQELNNRIENYGLRLKKLPLNSYTNIGSRSRGSWNSLLTGWIQDLLNNAYTDGFMLKGEEACAIAFVDRERPGYWALGNYGTNLTLGAYVPFYGSSSYLTYYTANLNNNTEMYMRDLAARPQMDGFWVMDRRGKVFCYGNAEHHGDLFSAWAGARNAWAIAPTSTGDGSVKNRGAFMFAGDVVLGNPYVADYKAYSSPPKGHHSVFGKAGKSGIQNNEWIIYNDSQFVLRYLVEFTQ